MRKKYEKEEIVDIGLELVRQNGYTNTGINDVLKASGIPKGSFYNFFESKEVFGVYMLERYGDFSLALIDEHLSNESLSPINRLKAFYQMLISANEEESCKNGCLINNLSSEVSGINDLLASTSHEQFDRLVDRITICIVQGQEQGEIITDHPSRELAYYIHSSFFGALNRAKAARNSTPLKLAYKMIFALIEK